MRKVISKNEIPTREDMLAWMQALAELGPRLAGTPSCRRGEDLIEGWFREAGLGAVTREPVGLQVWECGKAWLRWGGRTFPAYPIARSAFTPPEGIRAPLVFIGEGDPESLEGRNLAGKIVVAEVPFAPRPYQLLRQTAHAVHDPGNTLEREPDTCATWTLPTFTKAYAWSVARGAAGFVGILRDLRANRHRYHYPFVGPQEILPVGGVFIGRDDGAALRDSLHEGPQEGHIHTSGSITPGLSDNILGYLPGVSDGLILVTCHHDSPFGGLIQDAGGVAELLAMARYFARKKPQDRPLGMVFLAAAGNFVGSMGARDFLARHAHELVPRIQLTMTIEHLCTEAEEKDGRLIPAGKVEPRGVFVTDRPELLDLATLAIIGNDLRRTFVAPVPEAGGKTDGEASVYFAAGLPSITCVSGPEYVLTDDDRPEFTATEELVPVAKTFIEVIEAFLRLVGD